MIDNATAADNMSVMDAVTYDTLLVQAHNGLQNIEDPRIRFNTLCLMFVSTCRALGIDQQKILEMCNRAVNDAERQDTAEMRGIMDYMRAEYANT